MGKYSQCFTNKMICTLLKPFQVWCAISGSKGAYWKVSQPEIRMEEDKDFHKLSSDCDICTLSSVLPHSLKINIQVILDDFQVTKRLDG